MKKYMLNSELCQLEQLVGNPAKKRLNRADNEMQKPQALGQCKITAIVEQEPGNKYPLFGAQGQAL